MTVYIGFDSAVEYYSTECARRRSLDGSVPFGRLADAEAAAGPVREACERAGLAWLSRPVHVLVGSSSQARFSQEVVSHTVLAKLPAGSLVERAPGLAIVSPCCAFLQAARRLSPVALASLGNELAGTYIRKPAVYKLPRALTREKLLAYLQGCSSAVGVKTARRMARFVVDGAASPMETLLMLLLCLPPHMGGYGFALPRMNEPLALDAAAARGLPVARLRPDLSWPEHQIGLEYDSRGYHENYLQTEEDSSRRALFAATGFQVLSVTRAQVWDARRFHAVALALAKAMGRRLRFEESSFLQARLALREELFAPDHDGFGRNVR